METLIHSPFRKAATCGAENSFNAEEISLLVFLEKTLRNPLIMTMAIIAIASMYSPKILK